MRNISRNAGDVPLLEKETFLSVKFHIPALRVAYADLQTIVEVQVLAWNVRDLPVFAGQEKDRKVRGQIVAAVLGDIILGFWHIDYLHIYSWCVPEHIPVNPFCVRAVLFVAYRDHNGHFCIISENFWIDFMQE